jgi:hypothetical protein
MYDKPSLSETKNNNINETDVMFIWSHISIILAMDSMYIAISYAIITNYRNFVYLMSTLKSYRNYYYLNY